MRREHGDDYAVLNSIQHEQRWRNIIQATAAAAEGLRSSSTDRTISRLDFDRVSLYPDHGTAMRAAPERRQCEYPHQKRGKGAVAFFATPAWNREALERMKVEQSLRLAILAKRFVLRLSAKVDIRTPG